LYIGWAPLHSTEDLCCSEVATQGPGSSGRLGNVRPLYDCQLWASFMSGALDGWCLRQEARSKLYTLTIVAGVTVSPAFKVNSAEVRTNELRTRVGCDVMQSGGAPPTSPWTVLSRSSAPTSAQESRGKQNLFSTCVLPPSRLYPSPTLNVEPVQSSASLLLSYTALYPRRRSPIAVCCS
jgi:hypothetical protein